MPYRRLIQALAFAALLVSLLPTVRLGSDWMEYRSYLADFPELSGGSAESFDWVVWSELDGQIVAEYVFPGGPGDRGGLRTGDQFFLFGFRQFFGVEELRGAIRGAPPGDERTYLVERAGEYIEVPVRLTRHPTFLYPRSRLIWHFALWGFALGALIHLLALSIVAPLARDSREARSELYLIGISAAWILANLVRIAVITLFGPPAAGGPYDFLFQGLTGIGLAGLVGFPALLLDTVVRDALRKDAPARSLRAAIYLPTAILTTGMLATVANDHLGPVTLESLLAPILFYTAVYLAGAALIGLLARRQRPGDSEPFAESWGTAGALSIFAVSAAIALAIMGVIPLTVAVGERWAAALIVAGQLLAVVPVALFSFGTLRHGKVERVISGAIATIGVSLVLFIGLLAGLSVAESLLPGPAGPRYVAFGLYAVALALALERGISRFRGLVDRVFQSSRNRSRQALAQFQEELGDMVSMDELARRAVAAVAKGLDPRSVLLCLQPEADESAWISASTHREPPYLTESLFKRAWPKFEADPRMWARNPELGQRPLDPETEGVLREQGAALLIPLRRSGRSMGLLMLGGKRRPGAVFNLEDLDLLRSFGGLLALAVARLRLIERERDLARKASEAQLVALRSQINPHFLFNALNTIASHIETQPAEAEVAVEHLAAIFRYTLQTEERAFVSVQDELGLVEHYLAVEQSRFGEGLSVSIHVDEDLGMRPIPAFLIQTLVENAVKHGIEPKLGGGALEVDVSTGSADTLLISVSDTGVGIPNLFGRGESADTREFFGIGLHNIAGRLELLFGRDDLISMSSSPETGTRVLITVPDPVDAPAPDSYAPETPFPSIETSH